MFPIQHFFFGIIFSLVLIFLFPSIGLIGFSLILLSTVLIDADHYLYYLHKKKNWNLKKAYNWFIKNTNKFLSLPKKQRNNIYTGFCFLHGIEILLIFLLLTIFSRYFFFIFIGFSFHLLLDVVYSTTSIERIDRFSIAHDFLKFKKMKFIEDVKGKGD